MTLLHIENLEVSYGPVRALRSVNLSVASGEIIGLVGANGAGKTTLLRAISGLVKLQGGQIRFQNMDLRGARPETIVNAGIAHVPEGRHVWADMTIDENLMLGGVVCSRNIPISNRLQNVFTLFPELQVHRKQKAGTLSGGEQQMLAIGRGLMSLPSLLMLDEPSLGLAPIIVNRLDHIIQALNRDGMSVLLSEQNARLALRATHRTYVLAQGCIVSNGTPQKLLENSDLVAAYLGENPCVCRKPHPI